MISYRDISNHDGAVAITSDMPALAAKATEGSTFIDAWFNVNRSHALTMGVPFVPYHFLRHGNIAAQVAHALSVIGKGSPLMLDVETAGDGSKADVADVVAFMDDWHSFGGGPVTLVYLPHWYWQEIGSPSLAGIASRGAALISSNYTTYSDSGPGWQAYGGMTPAIWQYTSTPHDTNAFKGTAAQLAALITGKDSSMSLTGTDVASTLVKTPVYPYGPSPNVSLGTTWLATRNGVDAANITLAGIVKTEAAIQATLAGLAAGGSSVDTAALAAQIKAVGDAESAAVIALHEQIAELESRLVAAEKAAADALSTPIT